MISKLDKKVKLQINLCRAILLDRAYDDPRFIYSRFVAMTIFSLMHHFEINTSLLLLIFAQAKYNNFL